jgi:PAS domain S-box-containing protein
MEKMKILEEEPPDEYLLIEDLNADIKDLENYIRDLNTFLPIPLCIVNPINKIIDINVSLTAITGYSPDEMIGKKIYMLFKDEEDVKNIIKETVNNGYVKNHEVIMVSKEKQEIPIAINTRSRKDVDGEFIGYFVDFIDTTDITKMEETLKEKISFLEENKAAMLNIMEDLHETQEKLRVLNENLERKVKERTAEVKKLLKQKDVFIDQLGHDLNTPLTPLVGLLPILEKTEDDPESKEMIKVLRKNADRMRNLVVKFIKLAQLSASSTVFDIKDINLWEEAENSIKDQQFMYDERGFTVENKIDENIFVRADKLRLSEVFCNLISNAVKYTTTDGNIIVDAHGDGDFVTVSIIDSGIGMTNDQIDHIFDEFYKADESRHDIDSSGLGLSICKHIVEKHGGTIWAGSPGLEKGSTFYFTIPIGSKIGKEDISEGKKI